MAAVEAWLFMRLTTNTDVTAIVDKARIEPIKTHQRPDGTFPPAITYRRTSTTRTQHMGGSGNMATATFEIKCCSNNYLEAVNLGTLVRQDLIDRQLNQLDQHIRHTTILNEFDDDEPPYLADDFTTYARTLQIEIAHSEVGNQLITH